jgi:hypothetical protein
MTTRATNTTATRIATHIIARACTVPEFDVGKLTSRFTSTMVMSYQD